MFLLFTQLKKIYKPTRIILSLPAISNGILLIYIEYSMVIFISLGLKNDKKTSF